MKIIANIIDTLHDISLDIKFCSTDPGNNLTTKYDHKYLIITEIASIPTIKNSIELIIFIKSPLKDSYGY